MWRRPHLPSTEARSPPRRANWAVRIQVPVREGGAGSSSSAVAHRGAPTTPLAPGRAVGAVAVGAQPGTAPARSRAARPGPAAWPARRARHPLAPGPRCPVEAVGVDPRRAGATGATPRLCPIRAPVPTGVLDGGHRRSVIADQDRVGVGGPPGSTRARTGRGGSGARDASAARLNAGSSAGAPAQRGYGRSGGRRCTRGRRHTRPVRPVRLGAGTGGPVAERSGDSKRWPARIFHPPPRAPPIPKWRNDAIPRTRRSRRAPESHAPATFFRPADAPGRNGGAAGGLHRARAVIGTGPATTAGVASRSPRGNHRTAPGPARVSRSAPMLSRPHRPGGVAGASWPASASRRSAAPARGELGATGSAGRSSGADRVERGRFRRPRSRSAPTARPAWWDGVSHVVTRPARLDHLRSVGPPYFVNQVVQPHASGPTARKWSKQGSTAMTPLNNLPPIRLPRGRRLARRLGRRPRRVLGGASRHWPGGGGVQRRALGGAAVRASLSGAGSGRPA